MISPENHQRKAATTRNSPLANLKRKNKTGSMYKQGTGINSIEKTKEDVVSEIANHYEDLANRAVCISVHGDLTQCTCLTFLRGRQTLQRSIATAVLERYNDVSAQEKLRYGADCLRNASVLAKILQTMNADARLCYILPLVLDEYIDDEFEAANYKICQWAWCDLHNIGQTRIKTLKSIAPGGILPAHGNTGKKNRSQPHLEAFQNLKERFERLQNTQTTKHATRMVRDEAGYMSARGDDELDYLPPHFSMRDDWYRWVEERNWKFTKKCKAKQIFSPIKSWQPEDGFCRPEDVEAIARGVIPAKPVVSWPAYFAYWKKEFPKLKVMKAGEDTCTDCANIMNSLNHLRTKKARLFEELQIEKDDEGEPFSPMAHPNEIEVSILETIDELESKVADAKIHVNMHIAQREEYNRLVTEAKMTRNKALHERTISLTIDMGQNGQIPTLRGDQVGDFYYMSPLIQYIFGIHDAASNIMNTYIWGEGDAARGANNIVSCLYWDFERRGLFSGQGKLGHLALLCDNCAGQNKNRCVMKFAMWLVEAGFIAKVSLVFLIKGHTKNNADKWFNYLKRGTKGKNIWDETSLDEAYTSNNGHLIKLFRVPADRWRDFDSWFHEYYMELPKGATAPNHIFTFGGEGNPIIMSRQTFRDGEKILHNMLPSYSSKRLSKGFSKIERAEKIGDMYRQLRVIPAPGLSDIKQMEMYKKIRPIAPSQFHYFYPEPCREVLDRFKANSKLKRKKKDKPTSCTL